MNLYHTFQHIKNESTIEEALEACREEYAQLPKNQRIMELLPILNWVVTQVTENNERFSLVLSRLNGETPLGHLKEEGAIRRFPT